MSYKVVLAGGSGYIGRHLAPFLVQAGCEVVILSRSAETNYGRSVYWDGKSQGEWMSELNGALAVVNLSGVSVANHWSDENKLAIQESRILSTRAIGQAVTGLSVPPKVWVNSSATGYFGNRGEEELTEGSAPGAKGDFLVDLCVAWEDEFARADTPATRKVCMRTGVVLGKNSLALDPMLKAAKFFLGGRLGSGRQYMSWIHIDDLVSLIRWSIEGEITGTIDGVAPEPVTNDYFMAMMRGILRRPWAPPVPEFVLKLITYFGGPESSLILDSQRALPKAALDAGFVFKFPRLREALADLIL